MTNPAEPAMAHNHTAAEFIDSIDSFADRHLGPSDAEVRQMLDLIGAESLDELSDQTVPADIRLERLPDLPGPLREFDALRRLEAIALKNRIHRSFIGCGYHNTATPAAIRRNILENPGWYTQYTPYQAEIAQGRLEALMNFQTMVADLAGLALANASLLDEATAAAEALAMTVSVSRGKRNKLIVADHCHPQTLAVVRTRAWSMGLELQVVSFDTIADPEFAIADDVAGVLVQSPDTFGVLHELGELAERVHEAGAMLVVSADLLALALVKPPGEMGADIVCGTTQRFGCPMGGGGPHAGYIACGDKHARKLPGRLVGLSRDAQGDPAYRLAIQTREQHIKRDKATSNICTAQVLPAIIASMYGVYHGPEGLQRIARRVRSLTETLAAGLQRIGFDPSDRPRFDTLTLDAGENAAAILDAATMRRMNLRDFGDGRIGVSLDQTTTRGDVADLLDAFAAGAADGTPPAGLHDLDALAADVSIEYTDDLRRTSDFMTHPVFSRYRTEHELLRYITRLQSRDLSLTTSMIPLGSCTMKLNAAAEMLPITWPQFAQIHPYAPKRQQRGYRELYKQLVDMLKAITGLAAVSLQPNAGSQGEYAGLLAIRRYHEARGQADRDICLIPTSAHGTNPASAVIAGMKVVAVACRDNGDIDVDDLRKQAEQHSDRLAALMITYPSTHGVFEQRVRDICAIVHEHGGQVYMDGANMNAQVGLTNPAKIGADVCHLNLHKTFCIPHGGGGPGMGPIAVARHLAKYLPGDPLSDADDTLAVSAAPYGSPSILPISWMYITMMGSEGLQRASQIAMLNANYMAHRLREHFDVLYTGSTGRVAHEFIIDCRPLAEDAHVSVDDIAKRLMDFGFHAPTMSWPVAGTFMIEPTESESKAELDRFCEAMIAIRGEADAVASGELDAEDNPLQNAPHTQWHCAADDWPHGYSRERAAFAAPWLREHKFWPPVGRIDNPYGDRHLVCTCPSVGEFAAGD